MKKSGRKLIFLIYKKLATALIGLRLGEVPLFKKTYTILLANLKPDFIEIEGNKIFLDSQDSTSLSIHGIKYEGIETEFFKRNIKNGDTVLDIGAFIGYYSLLATKLVGERGKVFAFEADPSNFSLLEKNVAVNKIKNVILIQKAVSDKNGKIKLYLSRENKGDNRISDPGDGRKSINIESVKLDRYFKNYKGKINLIKLDIQGAEFNAVKGMTSLIKKNNGLKIISEFWPMALKKSGVRPEEYLKLLGTLGFKIYNINERENKLEKKSIKQILAICPKEKATNLFCVR